VGVGREERRNREGEGGRWWKRGKKKGEETESHVKMTVE
jgi:hypothetical protein